MTFNFQQAFETEFRKKIPSFDICGFLTKDAVVYPLGSDTKVLSTVFELLTRPAIYAVANAHGYEAIEPDKQNHYPDFTLHKGKAHTSKIAVDVKTTYRNKASDSFGFTLGGYTSFILPGNEGKNIVYPFTDYAEHWVIGFVYDRVQLKKSADASTYRFDQIKDIPLPFANVEFFVQEKWRIAGKRAGSGNTANIGSINGTLQDFEDGRGAFSSEAEFLEFWRAEGESRRFRDRANRKSNR